MYAETVNMRSVARRPFQQIAATVLPGLERFTNKRIKNDSASIEKFRC